MLNYVIRVATMVKETEGLLNTDFIVLPVNPEDFNSHVNMLNIVEAFRNGIPSNDRSFVLKSVPVSTKSEEKLMLINENTTNGKWYMSHSKDLPSFANDMAKCGFHVLAYLK